MKNPTAISISTARVAQLARVEKYRVNMQLLRTGKYKGVTPRKGANGAYAWTAVEVYRALGLFPDGKLPAAQGLQDRAVEATGADVLAAHQLVDWQHQTSRNLPTARERTDELFADARDVVGLLKAFRDRVGYALGDEEDMTAEDWATCNALAPLLEAEVRAVVRYLRWRSPATVKGAAR